MIKLVIFDIDGVFTDGNVLVDEDGREYKSFNLTEIDAVNDLKRQGFLLVAVTGESTPITKVFREKIAWDEFISGCKDKLNAVKSLEKKFHVGAKNICYIGDGKYDLEPINYVGFGVCPANAISQVKSAADLVLTGFGGKDCLKELADILNIKSTEV